MNTNLSLLCQVQWRHTQDTGCCSTLQWRKGGNRVLDVVTLLGDEQDLLTHNDSADFLYVASARL